MIFDMNISRYVSCLSTFKIYSKDLWICIESEFGVVTFPSCRSSEAVVRRQGEAKSRPVKRVAGWWFGCHEFYFPMTIGNTIIPTDFHIFQRGGPTTNQVEKCRE